MNLTALVTLLLAFSVSLLATPLVRGIAWRLRILDFPNPRKVHASPTPLLGGLGIYLGFAGSVLVSHGITSLPLEAHVLFLGGSLLLGIGVIDDAQGLPAGLKLAFQLLACLLLIAGDITLTFMPNTWWGYLIEWLLTIVWVLGITNAMNFFDGMDGLATGLGAIGALFVSLLAFQTSQSALTVLCLALLGSCLGFLPYNYRLRRPASIFLGDAGSTFIGFMLAGLMVLGGWGDKDPIRAFLIPVLILGVLIFDMVYITLSRVVSGKVSSFKEWIEYTGKDHLHHRLEALGLSKRQAVILIYSLSIALGLGALVVMNQSTTDALLLLLQAAVLFNLISILMVTRGNRLYCPHTLSLCPTWVGTPKPADGEASLPPLAWTEGMQQLWWEYGVFPTEGDLLPGEIVELDPADPEISPPATREETGAL
ncbi:MAG: undecaprenyl/decaprenyl-phosphate alpha-N-acetylglucosaminyl 1-phosphate transferase [Candidatus Tectomicrobia bacterium]|uniref:Undecaprenyl/decaprenyl-phosphate alpha-N-acetylglucosaminyl 1-phosphate transferase n=1 Tax=Tectimicrobiota bacterium TaxID=2528274 RepID=A0A932FXC9_UNCTE|nr:undecaprenyl/decaprenyl-phosphate alpha-N-acetylglucosaminyl 1-phosphate transferase [Candidatus Tectomicrobia bacterium]